MSLSILLERNMDKINQKLLSAFERLIDEKINKNKTQIRPTSVISVNSNGTYKIVLDGHTYNVPCSLGIDLKPCQNVWLMIPHGRMEWMHIYGIRK